MPIHKRYSKEGVLNSNKTVTKLVTQWLSKNKFTKDDWMKQNFTALIRYINLNLKVGNTVHNLANQYGSFEIYLSYLIRYIAPEILNENKPIKLTPIIKRIIEKKEEFSGGFKKYTIIADDDGTLEQILRHLEYNGNAGHSYSIILDPDATEKEGRLTTGWDGDGADRIMSITIEKMPMTRDEWYKQNKKEFK